MNLGTYIMRSARIAETRKILSFYKNNRNRNNAVREDEQLIETIDDKKLFVVINKDTQNIEAASGTFGYKDGEYMEAGATFVSPNLRGFKIGCSFYWISFLNVELLDPDFSRFFAVVRPDNWASIKSLESAGFFPTTPDATMHQLKDLTGRRWASCPWGIPDISVRFHPLGGHGFFSLRPGERLMSKCWLAWISTSEESLHPVCRQRGHHSPPLWTQNFHV